MRTAIPSLPGDGRSYERPLPLSSGHPGRAHYAARAAENLRRWQSAAAVQPDSLDVRVIQGDWGDVTGDLTRECGTTFAALNMANAYAPGGAYVEGAAAQEENMFRRTDCHFSIAAHDLDPQTETYVPTVTALLNAEDGRVCLDVEHPRLCIRGSEDRVAADLGYRFLADGEVFPFYELRAAAQDLSGGHVFDLDNARARIEAQLETLIAANVRHAVLGAIGCGAFLNPAPVVARLYREAIEERRQHFIVIAFAIYHAGYGPDNFTPFAEAFA